ncbi:hypothetical protein HAX54_005602 [Datura stramonium]|uniref:Exocyst subunit Exo70 family protein n=1 Tax=Datura stramonium TaxID=4076 RepID=A0ABS8TA86_DATST|nr:hypothetical protein [Datura stramonium]
MRTPFFSSSKSSSQNSPSSNSSHTFCESLMEETIENSQSIIKKWDLDASSAYNRVANLFRDNPLEAKHLLKAVNDLQHAMQFVIKDSSSYNKLLVRAHNLMQIAIKRLQREFHTILSGSSYFLDPETLSSRSSTEDNDEMQTKIGGVVMEDLKSIADCMIGAGYGRECVKIYKLNRKTVIDETLYYLGIEKLSSSKIKKMDWESLETKIKNWLSAVKIAVNALFRGERILCDFVFSASDNIRESCFSEIAKDGALTLFLFPEMVTKYKKKLSPEKIFRVLDLYDVVDELWVELESIFSFDSAAVVKSQATTLLAKLGNAARPMLSEFETAVQKDSSKVVSGGRIHPLTRYVMNYLVLLGEYNGAICDIIIDFSPISIQMMPESCYSSPTSGDGDSPSPAIQRLAWLVLVLLCKLDGKAQLYNDVPLSYLFLANNLNYVISKVRESNLKHLLGSDWISKHEMKVKEYMSKYERTGWSKIVTSIPENLTSEISPTEVKEYFNKFNSSFEEVYRKQSSWVIPDPKLRDHVKISLASKIIPIYQVFYEMYRGTESIVRFAPDDLQNYLSDLFHGASVSDASMGWTGSYSPSVSTSPSSSQGR